MYDFDREIFFQLLNQYILINIKNYIEFFLKITNLLSPKQLLISINFIDINYSISRKLKLITFRLTRTITSTIVSMKQLSLAQHFDRPIPNFKLHFSQIYTRRLVHQSFSHCSRPIKSNFLPKISRAYRAFGGAPSI